MDRFWKALIVLAIVVTFFLVSSRSGSDATINKKIADDIRNWWGSDVQDAARYYDVPAERILAVIGTESKGQELAVGKAKERGLGQFLKSTWEDVTGTNFDAAYDGRTNIFAIAKYLSQLRRQHGDLDTATGFYNASMLSKRLAYLNSVKSNEAYFA